jgi:hypothetical protein
MATISNVQLRINSIQNTTYRRALVALLVALSTVSFVGATSQTAMAGVKCKPNVRVTNNQGASIKVLNFKYKIGSNTIYTEGLVNKVLTPNETENWPSQTLNNAATGVVLTSTAVEYKKDTGSGYKDPPLTSAWFPHSFTCGSNHNYIHEIH